MKIRFNQKYEIGTTPRLECTQAYRTLIFNMESGADIALVQYRANIVNMQKGNEYDEFMNSEIRPACAAISATSKLSLLKNGQYDSLRILGIFNAVSINEFN